MGINSIIGPMTLENTMSIIGSLPNGGLYLAGKHPWSIDTLSLIVVNEFYALEAETIALIAEHDLELVIESAALEDVVRFAYRQNARVSLQELVDAFNYYYIHDAFMLVNDKSDDDK
jgi:hypothetical protein